MFLSSLSEKLPVNFESAVAMIIVPDLVRDKSHVAVPGSQLVVGYAEFRIIPGLRAAA
jgi:hypothetical protein